MTFHDFYYDEYVVRHENRACRVLHLVGIPISFAVLAVAFWWENWWLLLLAPVPIYFFAWLGHLAARNRPTFFAHPIWSLFGYWKMIGGMVFARRVGNVSDGTIDRR